MMQGLYGRLHDIARSALVLFMFLLPFFAIPVPWVAVAQSKGFLIGGILIVAAVLWVSASVAEGAIRLPKTALLFAVGLLPVAYVTSALFTGASWDSYVGDAASIDTVATVVTLFAVYVLTASLWAGRSIAAPLTALLGGGAALLLFSAASFFGGGEWATLWGALSGMAMSALGSWHDLAIFLTLFIFLVLFAAHLYTERWLLRALAYVSAGVAFCALVIINFADVWFGAAVLLGACGLFRAVALTQAGLTARAVAFRVGGVYVAGTLVALLFALGGTFIIDRLPQSLQVTHAEVRPSWQGTLAVGEAAWSGRELFFGTGPNTFARDWGLWKPADINVTDFWNVDFQTGVGTVPTVAVTVGMFGVAAWGFIVLILALLTLRREVREDPLALALLLGALFLTVYHILYAPGLALTFITFSMYGLVSAHRTVRTGVWSVRVGVEGVRQGVALALLCAVTLATIGISVQSVRRLVSDALVSRSAYEYSQNSDLDAAIGRITWANAVYPKNDRARRAAVELGLVELRALAAGGVDSEDGQRALRETLQRTIEEALTATVVGGGNYQNWLSLAELYGELAGSQIAGALVNARQAYARAREANPTNPTPVVNLARLELSLGNIDAARALLEESIGLKPNLAITYFFLSQVEAGAGNFATAVEAAEIATELASEDPLAWYNFGTILYAMKNYDDSARALERAVGLNANYANALLVLALSYHELDRAEEALATLETLRQLDPDHELPPRMIQNIKKGRLPLAPL